MKFKAIHNICLMLCFSGGAAKADDAAELYVKAGNSFKMAKKWSGKYAKMFVLTMCLLINFAIYLTSHSRTLPPFISIPLLGGH